MIEYICEIYGWLAVKINKNPNYTSKARHRGINRNVNSLINFKKRLKEVNKLDLIKSIERYLTSGSYV